MHPRSLSLEWIGFFVFVQTIAIAILAVGTVALLRFRTWRKERVERYKLEYGNAVADAVAMGEYQVAIRKPFAFQWIRRSALRSTLLENISSIVGPERFMLVEAYIKLGCSDDDHWDCSSYRWWVRLQALSNLSILKRRDFAPLFERMRSDRNSLVAASALIGLSQIEDRRNNPAAILPRLPSSFVRNVNLLLELSNNWSALYGHEWLGQYLRKNPKTKVAKSLTLVLITLKSEEATAILLEVLEAELFQDDITIQRMKTAIINTGDPSAVDRLLALEQREGMERAA